LKLRQKKNAFNPKAGMFIDAGPGLNLDRPRFIRTIENGRLWVI